jgi:hypothetical protein
MQKILNRSDRKKFYCRRWDRYFWFRKLASCFNRGCRGMYVFSVAPLAALVEVEADWLPLAVMMAAWITFLYLLYGVARLALGLWERLGGRQP